MVASSKQGFAEQSEDIGLSIALLGRPCVRLGAQDLTMRIKYRKGIALLAYLAAHEGVWQGREKLASLLWPELELGAARTNLRQVLNNLAALLSLAPGPSPLEKDDRAVRFVLREGTCLDIDCLSDRMLNGLMDARQASASGWRNILESRAAGLAGEFLDGLQLADTLEFEDWLQVTRQHFVSRSTLLLEHLCRLQYGEGGLSAAIRSARLLVQMAPLNEGHVLLLMSLLAESGDRRAALAAFASLQHQLAQELGVKPGSHLQALHEKISETGGGASLTPAQALPELRWMTVLYCDLGLRPEEGWGGDGILMSKVLGLIQRQGGTIVSTVGRGLLAVFGLGSGVERAAERALLAVRDIQNGPASQLPFRAGVHAGNVLVQATAQAPLLLGEVPDLAMLLGWSASEGEILLSESVVLQARGSFQFEALGERNLPGVAEAQTLFRLGAALEHPSLFPLADANEIPFSGRQDELAGLLTLWRDACAGEARIAILRAPAGLGKTRLAGELASQVVRLGGQVRRLACRLESRHQPLAPILAHLASFAGIDSQDAASQRRDKTMQVLASRYPGLEQETLETLASLLGENTAAAGSLLSKSATYTAVIRVVACLMADRPTLLIIDDLHWCDQATLELLGLFIKDLAHKKVLLVITARPELRLECPESLTRFLDLSPFSQAEALALVAASDPRGQIPVPERQRLAAACGGIPLFIERLAKCWQEGAHHQQPITELLQSELDRLGPAKGVLLGAAALGAQFSRHHLKALLPDSPVLVALEEAIAQRLILAVDEDNYAFRHALIRDTAYDSLPLSQRRTLHRQAACLLMAEEGQPAEAVAGHFAAAQCWKDAADWWNKAGKLAMEREFAADAQRCFEEALQMLEKQGAAENEVLAVQMQLGHAAQVAQGFGSPLAHRLFSQVAARLEARPTADPQHRHDLFSALSGRYMGGSSQGEVEGLNIARRLETLAQTDSERLMASFALGNSLFWRGEFQEARAWQQNGVKLAAHMAPQDRIRYSVDDPGVTCRAFLGWNLWFMGETEAACEMVEQGILLARQGRRTHALCFALTFAVAMHWCRGSVEDVVRLGSEAHALAKRHGLPLWEGVNGLFLLWAQARMGALTDTGSLFGAAAMMQEAYQAGITTSRWIAIHALVAQGAWDEADSLLAVTIKEADFHEDQYCLADLIWLQGESRMHRGYPLEAQEYWQQALTLARQQKAVGLASRFNLRLAQVLPELSSIPA